MSKTADIDFWYLQGLTYIFCMSRTKAFVQVEASTQDNFLLHLYLVTIFCPHRARISLIC